MQVVTAGALGIAIKSNHRNRILVSDIESRGRNITRANYN